MPFLTLILTTLSAIEGLSQQTPATVSLEEYLKQVLHHNEELQVQTIDFEISRQAIVAADAVFEPALVTSADIQDTDRPNNAEELRNLGGVQFFKQRQELYSTAVETLLRTGAQAQVGLDLRRINNNLQQARRVDQEWSAFLGLSFVQPLLRGAGQHATLSALRVAALESDQAFQELRRQTMVILTGAELAYWNLYAAQEQERFSEDALTLSRTLHEDSLSRLEAGTATELDVLEARVALTDREATLGAARQGRIEAANVARGFLGGESQFPILTRPPPLPQEPKEGAHDLALCLQQARAHNPDYVVRQRQIAIERLRWKFARNQAKPNLDLRGSFGVTGLSEDLGDAMSEMSDATHPTWALGVEFRLPLGGGRKGQAELRAARLRHRQAALQLNQLHAEMHRAVENALQKVESTRKQVESYTQGVGLHQQVLDTEWERLRVGQSSNQPVLEAEEKLFEARNIELSNRILHQRALLELYLVMGVILEKRDVDLSREDVARRTAEAMSRLSLSEAEAINFDAAVKDIIRQYP